ncbi:hypothetical protein [Sulfitobacter sp. S190]|uniref:hypothetical protein n=1 Tax=Sulfitobacter sp. S190 TaxID=2867022 RepID=UPI0021A3AD1B|nr:hypothetical protein [Sulfitobacter sp. S190]UWR23350.1 hypothetical protein K3756_05000 [Sulfitobacter sp. S190]
MKRPRKAAHLSLPDAALALLAIVGGGLMAVAWIPAGTATGLVDIVRGQRAIGDALAPTVAALLIAIGGVLLAIEGTARRDPMHLTRANVMFVARLAGALVLAMLLMRHGGPLAYDLLGPGTGSFRARRLDAPWAYIGIGTGGTFLICALALLAGQRPGWRMLAVAVLGTATLAALFGLPFAQLQLPPAGDL